MSIFNWSLWKAVMLVMRVYQEVDRLLRVCKAEGTDSYLPSLHVRLSTPISFEAPCGEGLSTEEISCII
ncbi:hypothetical protein E2C01_099823 [Portunus trituberculatus]|uniref:Uncharacterized protein n=1 Tax=Portunus trituberculatus TaxID=210409 RepID=A0A5B7KAJ3_PORTR|nr:hypothetical protein [Portunus trituberculatus]